MVDESVFKAYDIRGVYPEQINEELAYLVGRAFVNFLDAKDVVVGMDMRESSKRLYENLSRGITDQGANVHFLGMCTTPLMNFATAHYKFGGGIMISASHNPGQYNAFKMVKFPVLQIGKGSGMEEIQNIVLDNSFANPEKKGEIFDKKKQVFDEYLGHVKKFAEFSGLTIVVDYGNGVGALTAKPLFEQTKNSFISFFEEPDGSFPNHPANPHDLENFQKLQQEVVKNSADLGVFFDGDADRAIFVDEKGEIISNDFTVCLLALEELKEFPGETVYYDLRFSKIVKEKIEQNKGKAVMERVGNPYYKKLLVEKGGILGGEFSGHVMFKSNYNIDDGLFCTVKFLNLVAKSKKNNKKTSDLVKPLKRYFQTPEINITVQDNNKKNLIISKIKDYYLKKGLKILEIDGISVQSKDFWFNLRKSNTEPIIRIRAEADTAQLLEDVKKELLGLVNRF